jgi:Uma2 family endonuclease
MGQGGKHSETIVVFFDVLRVLLAAQRRKAYISWDLFVEWDPNDPRARVSPDVLLIDGQPPDIEPSLWRTWEPGCDPPRFALEVVSDRSRSKDYDDNPGKYSALGAEELVIFDSAAGEPDAPRESIVLQVYRRSPRGQFLLVYSGDGPVESVVLGAWLVVTDGGRRLRLACNADGTDLVPRAEERADAAETRVKQLEEELARLRGAGK